MGRTRNVEEQGANLLNSLVELWHHHREKYGGPGNYTTTHLVVPCPLATPPPSNFVYWSRKTSHARSLLSSFALLLFSYRPFNQPRDRLASPSPSPSPLTSATNSPAAVRHKQTSSSPSFHRPSLNCDGRGAPEPNDPAPAVTMGSTEFGKFFVSIVPVFDPAPSPQPIDRLLTLVANRISAGIPPCPSAMYAAPDRQDAMRTGPDRTTVTNCVQIGSIRQR